MASLIEDLAKQLKNIGKKTSDAGDLLNDLDPKFSQTQNALDNLQNDMDAFKYQVKLTLTTS